MYRYKCRHVKSELTRLTRVGSQRAELKMTESNSIHFMVSQKFCNSSQPTTGWWIKLVGSPIHIKNIIYVFIFKYSNI